MTRPGGPESTLDNTLLVPGDCSAHKDDDRQQKEDSPDNRWLHTPPATSATPARVVSPNDRARCLIDDTVVMPSRAGN